MHFKTVKSMMIYNKPKRTISINNGLELLQMISESDIRRDASKDVDSKKGGLRDPILVEERNENLYVTEFLSTQLLLFLYSLLI